MLARRVCVCLGISIVLGCCVLPTHPIYLKSPDRGDVNAESQQGRVPLSDQFPHCLATHLRASDSLRPWRYTNLLTYL